MSDNGCITRDHVKRARVFPLDECGGITIVGTASVIDWADGFETIGFSEQVTAGDRETIPNIRGGTSRDKLACATDRGEQLVFSEVSENWSLMASMGYGELVYDGADIIGFDRTPVDCTAAVAIELLFALPAECDADVTQCLARLYPKVDTWVLGGTKQVDGKKAIRGTYTGNTQLNKSVFRNFVTPGTPTGELAYWAPYKTAINLGSAYFYDRIIDCPDFDDDLEGCDLRAFALTTGS